MLAGISVGAVTSLSMEELDSICIEDIQHIFVGQSWDTNVYRAIHKQSEGTIEEQWN